MYTTAMHGGKCNYTWLRGALAGILPSLGVCVCVRCTCVSACLPSCVRACVRVRVCVCDSFGGGLLKYLVTKVGHRTFLISPSPPLLLTCVPALIYSCPIHSRNLLQPPLPVLRLGRLLRRGEGGERDVGGRIYVRIRK